MELPKFSSKTGYAMTDITIIKKRKVPLQIPNIKEEHPNMSILMSFPLFASFKEGIMERIASTCYEVKKKAGQAVITKGEEAAEIFFLLDGTVSVELTDTNHTHLRPTSFFGELGVLYKFKRTATVRALTDCVLLVVTKQRMDEAMDQDPETKKIVEDFAIRKEEWWKTQKYLAQQERFGAEFAQDIARKDLKKVPIFSSAPDSFIQSLAIKTKCFVAEENEIIVSIGEESDAIYFILSGVLEVVGDDGVVHADMTDGAFFGEVGVLMNLKRTASIRAKVKSNCFKLSKYDLDTVVSGYPAMKLALEEVATNRFALFKQRILSRSSDSPDQFDVEIGTQSLAKLSIFHGVDTSIVNQLSMKMVRTTWKKGEYIIECGEVGDGMYFLAAGDAEVISEFGDVIDKVSGPSAYFGEVALLEDVPRTASIKCTSVCSTYGLKKSDFLSVLESYPAIAGHIKETAGARMHKYLMRNVLA
ncbi:cyclic nucleotide-binding-like protein [Obelidium mucronatum]|nr:cyclic nucleotide-binding-like protein [Obelidium mucronatum]